MKRFYASRLTQGNELFPARITIDNSGVHLRLPSFMSGQERTIPFRQISSVEINCPFIGYSTITFQTTGQNELSVHGFTFREVKKMRSLILSKI